MKNLLLAAILLVCSPVNVVAQSKDQANELNWPQFRGQGADGVLATNPPTTWNEESGKNIAWKVKVPGLGHSAPIVWGNRIYLTTAISELNPDPVVKTGWLGGTGDAAEEKGKWTWEVRCYSLGSGKLIWRRVANTGNPRIQRHMKATHANCTPATDGKSVVAFFGSEGLFCYDMDGELKWKKDLGRLHSGPFDAEELEWGFASSPVIHNDKVVVQCDCLNTAFLGVFDINDGSEIWRIERDDVATWSTPAIVSWQGTTQVVCNGYRQMAGYDFSDGKQLWKLSGGGDVPVPTPIFADGLILLTNAHGRSPVYAIHPEARGDITPAADDPDEESDEKPEPRKGLVWHDRRDGSYMPTPIVVGKLLYTCNDNGRLNVRRVADGEVVYRKRIGAGPNFSASAVATPERVYFFDESGDAFVVATGEELQVVARNSLAEPVLASPALAKDQLIVRSLRHLICIRAVQ